MRTLSASIFSAFLIQASKAKLAIALSLLETWFSV